MLKNLLTFFHMPLALPKGLYFCAPIRAKERKSRQVRSIVVFATQIIHDWRRSAYRYLNELCIRKRVSLFTGHRAR